MKHLVPSGHRYEQCIDNYSNDLDHMTGEFEALAWMKGESQRLKRELDMGPNDKLEDRTQKIQLDK